MTYTAEELNSIAKLEALEFEGIDADLEESLFEYGMIWKKVEEGGWLFIHVTPHTYGLPKRDGLRFDSTPMDEQSLSWMSLTQEEEIAQYADMKVDEWKEMPFCQRVHDAVGYFGVGEIFGESYGDFSISNGVYRIPVVWEMYGEVEVVADSLEEAKELAIDEDLPDDGEYVDGSFEVNEDCANEMYLEEG